jgi:trehalose/maltose hydrolase-like predicted phosphorylase
VLARWNLRRAAAAALAVDDDAVPLDELDTWHRLADALVDGFDPATRVYEEFAGFHGLEPALVRDLVPHRPVTADLVLGPERVHRSQIVKQTDVLMLHHLLPDEVEPGSLAPNLDFYEPRTAHGSSLSLGIHAALLARSGRADDALAVLRAAADLDENDVTRTGAGGVHLGAMGSVWQALAYGFAGLRPHGDALAIDPHLPGSWSGLEIGVQFRGVPVRLRLEHDAVVVSAPAPIVLDLQGDRVTCAAGQSRLELRV